MITPETLARSGSEHGEQAALFCWASLAEQQTRFPMLKWMHAIPGGGSRGDTAQSRAIRGGQLKAEGVKAGVADIFLPVSIYGLYGRYGLYIEMKRKNGKPGDVSKEQTDFGMFVKSQGYQWHVCFGWLDASKRIEQYLTNA
jgi:hypothetical protein